MSFKLGGFIPLYLRKECDEKKGSNRDISKQRNRSKSIPLIPGYLNEAVIYILLEYMDEYDRHIKILSDRTYYIEGHNDEKKTLNHEQKQLLEQILRTKYVNDSNKRSVNRIKFRDSDFINMELTENSKPIFELMRSL